MKVIHLHREEKQLIEYIKVLELKLRHWKKID